MNTEDSIAAAVRAALVIPAFVVCVAPAPRAAAADAGAEDSLQEVVILGRGETRQVQAVSPQQID